MWCVRSDASNARGGKEKSFSVDIGGRGRAGCLGVRSVVGGSYIVTRSRVHFAACIDPVVFFLLNAAALRDFRQFTLPINREFVRFILELLCHVLSKLSMNSCHY